MGISLCAFFQKRSGDPNPQYFSKSTAVQMGGVLPYKWEAYCSTNGRRIAGFPFLRSLEARKAQRYKWGAYCRTNWRCTAVLFRQIVGVGVSETLPIFRFLGTPAWCPRDTRPSAGLFQIYVIFPYVPCCSLVDLEATDLEIARKGEISKVLGEGAKGLLAKSLLHRCKSGFGGAKDS